ncbi:hypothetical protein BGZ89_006637 [Linnemannia elongata]|nr:hypothetical protein BGZ89_006637 [Linnemannia elongata]
MESFFSSVILFKHLCGLEIGAYVEKKFKSECDQLSGAVVGNTAIAVVWVDNAPVPMLRTIHQITGDNARISRLRYCPRTTSTSTTQSRTPSKDQHYAF